MILNELQSLIEEHIKPGQYMFSDRFFLEDTLPAVEFGHAKMDRGTVLIQNQPALDFVNHWHEDIKNLQNINLLGLLQSLLRLEMTWYNGRASFSDTLLICILCHRDARGLPFEDQKVALAVEAAMTVASLISFLCNAAPVIHEEDFHANLYGMTWWTPITSSFLSRNELEIESLLERLMNTCRAFPSSSSERFYFARYYYWIKFLNTFLWGSVVNLIMDPIADLIEDLQVIELPADAEDHSTGLWSHLIFPELSNLFGAGCVRSPKPILSLDASIKQWNRILADDLGSLLKSQILLSRPRLNELLQLLAERSRNPLKPPLLAPTRALLFFSILPHKRAVIYQSESLESFLLSSCPGLLSQQVLHDALLFISDLVQVYCANVSRQRRLLPGLILTGLQQTILPKASHDSSCLASLWLQDLHERLQIDLILLLGRLKLLRGDEGVEAAGFISRIFESFEASGRKAPTIDAFDEQIVDLPLVIHDAVRFKHRWDFLAGVSLPLSVPSNVLEWFRGMARVGYTGHSLSQQEWHDDEAIQSSQQSNNNYTFTMYTSEL